MEVVPSENPISGQQTKVSTVMTNAIMNTVVSEYQDKEQMHVETMNVYVVNHATHK